MIALDIETAPIADAALYIEPASAPSNYKDPEKIRAYVEDANRQAVARAALDVDLCRVVALGVWWDGMPDKEPTVKVFPTEGAERNELVQFWHAFSGDSFCGFNVLDFDLPVLLRRSLYLGIDAPKLDIGKYKHPRVTDLMQMLSYDGKLKYRGLSFYCKRFGIPDTDTISGADVGAAIERGDWELVRQHCASDVEKTVALARRLGVLCDVDMVA